MINIFIGYDEGETVAFHTLSESIRKHSTSPVSITPLCLGKIPGFTREKQPNQSTDFAFSRFMVPHLSNYKGWSIFMDCDMLLRDDITKLWDMRDTKYSVMCCKHDYEPKQGIKFRGAKNEKFPKKNWSSFMMMNKWNWLVGEYDYNEEAKNIHFTLGGPYFKDYKDCDYSKEWYDVYNEMSKVDL